MQSKRAEVTEVPGEVHQQDFEVHGKENQVRCVAEWHVTHTGPRWVHKLNLKMEIH